MRKLLPIRFALLGLAAIAAPVAGQAPAMPFADSLAVFRASLGVFADSGLIDLSRRLWVRSTPLGSEAVALSEVMVDSLRITAPDLRHVPVDEYVFECPDGGRPQFPGRSCPIRDDGLIVGFGSMEVVDEKTIVLWLYVTEPSGISGRKLRLRRHGGGGSWVFDRFLGGMMTDRDAQDQL